MISHDADTKGIDQRFRRNSGTSIETRLLASLVTQAMEDLQAFADYRREAAAGERIHTTRYERKFATAAMEAYTWLTAPYRPDPDHISFFECAQELGFCPARAADAILDKLSPDGLSAILFGLNHQGRLPERTLPAVLPRPTAPAARQAPPEATDDRRATLAFPATEGHAAA